MKKGFFCLACFCIQLFYTQKALAIKQVDQNGATLAGILAACTTDYAAEIGGFQNLTQQNYQNAINNFNPYPGVNDQIKLISALWADPTIQAAGSLVKFEEFIGACFLEANKNLIEHILMAGMSATLGNRFFNAQTDISTYLNPRPVIKSVLNDYAAMYPNLFAQTNKNDFISDLWGGIARYLVQNNIANPADLLEKMFKVILYAREGSYEEADLSGLPYQTTFDRNNSVFIFDFLDAHWPTAKTIPFMGTSLPGNATQDCKSHNGAHVNFAPVNQAVEVVPIVSPAAGVVTSIHYCRTMTPQANLDKFEIRIAIGRYYENGKFKPILFSLYLEPTAGFKCSGGVDGDDDGTFASHIFVKSGDVVNAGTLLANHLLFLNANSQIHFYTEKYDTGKAAQPNIFPQGIVNTFGGNQMNMVCPDGQGHDLTPPNVMGAFINENNGENVFY